MLKGEEIKGAGIAKDDKTRKKKAEKLVRAECQKIGVKGREVDLTQ